MTVPVLAHDQIPFDPNQAEMFNATPDIAIQQYVLSSDETRYTVTPISMGNPHAVIFVDDLFNTDVVGIGQKLTHHPA